MSKYATKCRLLFWQLMNRVIDRETFDQEMENMKDKGQAVLSLTPVFDDKSNQDEAIVDKSR